MTSQSKVSIRNSSQLIDWIFLTSPLFSFRNYKKALDVMKQATAMPSSRTSFYDEVKGKIGYITLGWVVQKAISANPGLKFNRLFILVRSA